MDSLLQDLRYGWRTLLKQPGFVLIAVLTLALGIGANTALFSVINAVLLRPLPFAEPQQLIVVRSADLKTGNGFPVTWPDYADWRTRQTSFTELAAYDDRDLTLTGLGEAVRLRGALVTANLFPLLGAQPLVGRQFAAADEQAGAHSVILSYNFWQNRFAGDPQAVGRTLMLGGVSFDIVGVMPKGFNFPLDNEAMEMWISPGIEAEGAGARTLQRGNHWLDCVGRLKPGVSLGQAQAEMGNIVNALAREYPDTNSDLGVQAKPLAQFIIGDVSRALWTLFAAVGCVLLIACANVANLLLARSAIRQREMAVRAALGAQRGRVMTQLLTESILLALLGGLLGVLLAWWGTEALLKLVPAGLPRAAETTLDARVLGFTVLLALLTGIIFGLAPAWQATKTNLVTALKEGTRSAGDHASHGRLRNALVVAQVAVAFCLLIAAGLLLNSFWRLQQVKPGFNTQNLLSFRLRVPGSQYNTNQRVIDFYEQLRTQIAALPGVVSASASLTFPFTSSNAAAGFAIEGVPTEANKPFPHNTALRVVQPGYFQTMGIELLQGRAFDTRDNAQANTVVVINEALARRYFPNQNPLGRRINPSIATDNRGILWREIVGVIRDVRHASLTEAADPECYLVHAQAPLAGMALVVRTTGDPQTLLPTLRDTVHQLDANLPLYAIKTADESLADAVAQPRFTTLLLSLFAGVALLLTAIGLYGVLAYNVTQCTREIGVRMALGAQPGNVIKLVLQRGMSLALLGVGLGLAASLGVTQLLKKFLFGVSATDPLTFAAIAGMLLLVALLACLIPARRATKVDPLVALRYE